MNRKRILFLLSISIMSIGALFIGSKKIYAFDEALRESKAESRTFLKCENLNYTKEKMNLDFRKFTGEWSFFELTLDKESDISIEDNSKISCGKVDMVILDNNYNIISEKAINGEEKCEFYSRDGGKYIIKIIGKNASGHFGIKISSNSSYDCLYKGGFDVRGSLYSSFEKWR